MLDRVRRLLERATGTGYPVPPTVPDAVPPVALSPSTPRQRDPATTNAAAAALGLNWAGQPLQPGNALALASVQACISLYARLLGAAVPRVVRRTGNVVTEVEHPLRKRFNLPSPDHPHVTWNTFIASVTADILGAGGSLIQRQYSPDGELYGLVHIPISSAIPEVLASGSVRWTVPDPLWSLVGTQKKLLPDDYIYIKEANAPGSPLGMSRIARASLSMNNALALENFVTAAFNNATRLSGILSVEGTLGNTALERIKTVFSQLAEGNRNAGKIAVVDQSAKYTPFDARSPGDFELVAQRQYATAEAARVFQIPTVLISASASESLNGANAILAFFVRTALLPFANVVSSAFSQVLLPEDLHLELNLDNLLRGTWAEVAREILLLGNGAALTPDECRELLGFGPLPDSEVGSKLRASNSSTVNSNPSGGSQ